MPEAGARFYLVEIALALKHLHDQFYTHRDLKPQNVMLDRDGHVQLIDLGLAALSNHDINAQVASRHNSIVGAVGYQAPEMLFVDKLAKGYSYSRTTNPTVRALRRSSPARHHRGQLRRRHRPQGAREGGGAGAQGAPRCA